MKFIILFFLSFYSLVAISAEENSLTLSQLEKEKFVPMTGSEMSAIILGKTILLKDLLSGAIYEVEISKYGFILKKKIKEKSPGVLTSVEYNSRAALLTDSIDLTIKENKIITSDGVRTYISTLYKKNNLIYGVRDIDHDSVNFQIILKK